MAELVGGIALTLSEPVTALVGWVIAKLRGHDLFDEVMRDAEADAGRLRLPLARCRPSATAPAEKDEGGSCGFRLLPFRSDVICGPSRQLRRLSP